jgi:hypothetical protein
MYMTALFRMAFAVLFQSVAYLIRFFLFLFLAFIRPLDYVADWLSRVAIWLAIDEKIFHANFPLKESPDDRSDSK